jgi:transposase InsO family protein
MKPRLIAIVFLAFSPLAGAEQLALGSMELQVCAKGRERATLVLEIEAPNFRRVRDELRQCAKDGVAAATLPALLKKQPAAEPLFWEEFQHCSRYTEWISAELSIQTFCR